MNRPQQWMKPAVAQALARVPLFAALADEHRRVLAQRLVPVKLTRDETLFREGDAGTALYVVETGAVRVLARGEQEVCRIGRGGHVGEMALVDDAPRSATVVAACDATLWRLGREEFEALTREQPSVYREIAAALAQRLRETTAREMPVASETMVLMLDARGGAGGSDGLPDQLALAIEGASGRSVAVVPLTDSPAGGEPVDARVGQIADVERFGATVDQLLEQHGHVLLFRDAACPADARLRAACGRVDLAIVVLTTATESLASAERALATLGRLAPALPAELALDRRPERVRASFDPVDKLASGRPVHTLAATPGYARAGPPDYAGLGRLARRIARRRVGLALGGGGARAFAHIGVLAVLERAGVPVDVLAGTSGGAIVAGLTARDWDSSRVAEFLLARWTRRGVLDFRMPWLSMLRGRKLDRIGRDAGEGLTIQELTRPFVAVATDLVTGEEVRLRRGDGWTAVRASLTVPGVFPPVRLGDRYLVDGGALDNLPAAAAREAGADIVIGVNVSPPLEPAFLPAASDRRRGPLGQFIDALRAGLPIARVIYRTVTVQGQALRSRQGAPDCTLAPDVSGFDMFQFTDLESIIARGRIAAEKQLDEICQAVFVRP